MLHLVAVEEPKEAKDCAVPEDGGLPPSMYPEDAFSTNEGK